jgi:hypothetical protein
MFIAALLAVQGSPAADQPGQEGRSNMNLEPVDIASFALPNTEPGQIWFEEPRDVARVMVEFAEEAPDDIGLSYLRKIWPEVRLEESANRSHPSALGWVRQDDWFNRDWQRAAIEVSREGARRIWITFHGLKTEFPELEGYDVVFRRTLGLRLEVPDTEAIQNMAVFTESAPTRSVLRVTLDAGRDTPGNTIRLTGYNAFVEAVAAVQGVAVDEKNVVELGSAAPRQFEVTLKHMIPVHDYSGDDGLVTFALDDDAFTISLTSIEKEGPIWFEDVGFFIVRADDPVTFADYRARIAGSKTLAQQVLGRSEQSFAGAFYGQPRPHAASYNLGCTHARQRFWLEGNGDIVLHKSNVTWIPGKDTDRFKNNGTSRFFFGLEKWPVLARFPDPEPVVAYNLHTRHGDIVVEQKSFAVPLLTSIQTGEWAGDDPMVALVRFRFRNEGDGPARAALPIHYSQVSGRSQNPLLQGIGQDDYLVPLSPRQKLSLSGNRILSRWKNESVLRCTAQTTMACAEEGNGIMLTQQLEPGETCEVVLRIPYIALETDEEQEALERLDFERCYREVTAYWRRVGRRGAYVHTPEPQLGELHTAHLAHVLITDFEMPDGSGLVNTSVGTSTYGNFSNESCMIVHDLDQRGLHDEARRRLGIWLKYQGTVPQPGNFTDHDGMFFGAGGFESGAYNQHHGWVLWCLCEHYFLTRDEEWFRGIADAVIAGADWVFRQRRNTMSALPHSRGWEYGFLPAGSLEDVTDFYYWLSTNALTWRGVEWAARALEAVDHPEASRIRREADGYRNDLVRGFETMRRHAPLVRLRDGRWVPHYPTRLYRRGREVGWIRETLEGAVYLLISGLYDVRSREAQWILDDFQDNRYVSVPYGYFIPDFEMNWFDRGGISIQPNLLAGLMPYLERDEPELYIWMFYNAWCACYREDIKAMIEHPLPVLGFSNALVFKTSDQANAVTWLRSMFVYTSGDLLHLGRAIPRAWFGQPEAFEARDVATPFGVAGVRYQPVPDKNVLKVNARLELAQDPGRVLIRFRHPQKRKIREVRVDGTVHTAVDRVRGDVDITGRRGEVEIEVEY